MLLSPLDQLIAKSREQLVYVAHLSALLQEACQILDKLEVSVDVSEHLAHWWEHHKPEKKEELVEAPVDVEIELPKSSF